MAQRLECYAFGTEMKLHSTHPSGPQNKIVKMKRLKVKIYARFSKVTNASFYGVFETLASCLAGACCFFPGRQAQPKTKPMF
jgi:hypothetical protein